MTTIVPSGPSLVRYQSFLPDRTGRVVAILASHESVLEPLLDEFQHDRVLIFGPSPSPDWDLDGQRARYVPAASVRQFNWRLRMHGPFDIIVDLLGRTDEDEADLWSTLFFHLQPHGAYALHRPALRPDRVRTCPSAGERASEFLARYWSPTVEPPPLPRLERELIHSCARFVVDRSFLVIEKRNRHYVKLRDGDVGRLLPQRNIRDTVTTLATLPSGHLQARGRVISHGATRSIAFLDTELSYPQLRLQHYVGRLGLIGNSLLIADSTVLPASYRYPTIPVMTNPRIINVNADFARLSDDLRPQTRLKGNYYHLDCWHSGHFGHVMSEVVSRLWGWHRAKREIPDLKAIFRRRYPNERHPDLELALFTAFGIPREDIVWVDEPVWLPSVVTATPMWQNQEPYFVHPEITATWERLRTGLVTPMPEAQTRIFVSRRQASGNRMCRNIDEVEDFVRARGFTVVYPEDHDLRTQAAIFGSARVVAGFAGSGLYNIMFCRDLAVLVVLGHEAYTARYEHLFSLALGCDAYYFWNQPEVDHPEGGWSEEAYYSAWSFDFERNGDALHQLLTVSDLG